MAEMGIDMSTSVTGINGYLIISLSGEMTDDNIAAIAELVTDKAHQDNVKGAILNFSALTVLDTYTFYAFRNLTAALALMGVRAVWVGLRPGVVSALMDLNIEINTDQLLTALNLEQGLELLSYTNANTDEGAQP